MQQPVADYNFVTVGDIEAITLVQGAVALTSTRIITSVTNNSETQRRYNPQGSGVLPIYTVQATGGQVVTLRKLPPLLNAATLFTFITRIQSNYFRMKHDLWVFVVAVLMKVKSIVVMLIIDC